MTHPGQAISDGEALRDRARAVGLSDAKISRDLGLYSKTVARVWRDRAQQRHFGQVKRLIENRERDVLAGLARLHPNLAADLASVLTCPDRGAPERRVA